ncbi:hypothetical protein GE061_003227 [Apolygus lucorum]|uniref:Uncharacterized protein n=1 Tax=Apolygus lucorum TaxID=248454 RepID=A0A6A4JD26_APOLU|nr:hypothetical protein GE061_003227 [Apolygus lucorum]
MDDEEEEERILRHPSAAIFFPSRSCSCLHRVFCFLLLLLLLQLSLVVRRAECRTPSVPELQPTDSPPPLYDDTVTTQDWRRTTREVHAESRCPHEAGGRLGSIVDIDLSVNHPIFTTNVFVPSIVYQANLYQYSEVFKRANSELWPFAIPKKVQDKN